MNEKTIEKQIGRAKSYLQAKNLVEQWSLLSDAEKLYAMHLVENYMYPMDIAIQRAYIFGYDKHPFDYKTKEPATEMMKPEDFGL